VENDKDTCPECGSDLTEINRDGVSPAKMVIDAFGDIKKLSEATGIDKTAIYRWTYPKDKHGSNGRIPSSQQSKILKAAKSLGIKLKPEQLVDV